MDGRNRISLDPAKLEKSENNFIQLMHITFTCIYIPIDAPSGKSGAGLDSHTVHISYDELHTISYFSKVYRS